jgi:multicomponent Na+:H+ antiporter subunit D
VRRMLAYSSIGQMGYIVLGLAIGTPLALSGALLHMLNHGVMKSCLFLVAGGVYFQKGARDVAAYDGVARRLPMTMAAFVLAAASMVGLPPTGGFFSKWYLLLGAIDAQAWLAVVALVLSSLLTAVYLFRIVERAYLHAPCEGNESLARARGRLELPGGILAPILVLGVAVLLLGVFNQAIVTHLITLAIPASGGR